MAINDEYHVVPLDDFKIHEISADCWCNPEDDGGIIIHNAADSREDYETGKRKPH